jgi:hypothetical protein
VRAQDEDKTISKQIKPTAILDRMAFSPIWVKAKHQMETLQEGARL